VPLAKYFVGVGGALAVLLLIAGWSLPVPPPSFSDRPEIIKRAAIRIRSERKWPEKIILDTSHATIPTPFIDVAPAEQLAVRSPEETTDPTRIDSLAKLDLDVRLVDANRPPARAKRKATRASPSTHVAKVRRRDELPALGTGEGCCRFEWVDRPAMTKAASRKRVARRETWMGWSFLEPN
jgi:hypothetical protein